MPVSLSKVVWPPEGWRGRSEGVTTSSRTLPCLEQFKQDLLGGNQRTHQLNTDKKENKNKKDNYTLY